MLTRWLVAPDSFDFSSTNSVVLHWVGQTEDGPLGSS